MPNQWDLTNENIENTYQRVLQTPDGVNIYDGTGSLFTLPTSGVSQITAGNGISISPAGGTGIVEITSTAGSYNTATGSYGSFYDTGSYPATSTTTIYSMSLSTTDISNGVYVSGSDRTRIYVTNAGVYNFQFSAQFSNNSTNDPQDVAVWLRKNDGSSANDIVDSNSFITVPGAKGGNPGQIIAAWNFFLELAANDFVQLLWHAEKAGVITLETIAAGTNPTHPRTPSLIATVQRVDTFLSNTGSFSGSFIGTHTGSFSGSFTGSLLGTASWADSASQALTASFYQETDPIFVSKSASLATTGSNTFIGNQIVSGSIITTGSIGVGISTPITKLHVTSGSSGASIQSSDTAVFESNNHTNVSILSPTGQNSSLQFGSAGDILGAYIKWNQDNNLMTLGTANDGDDISFITGNETSSMYLKNNIGLGIGTTAPLYRLHVRNGAVTNDSTFAGSVGVFENSASNSYLSILSHDGYSSGVGFGSNIHRSSARLAWTHNSLNFSLSTNTGSAFLTFGTGDETERMRITTDGLVGIGTTTPQYMLDVSGSARVTSSLYLPGLTSSPEVNVVLINTSSGQLYYTASSAIGGGGPSQPPFPYTGSAVITGSLVVTGSIESTLGFTGSLFGTASWADSASQALTASFLPVNTYSITSSWAQSASQALTASYVTGSIYNSTNPALSASYALTASYALNGGVTSISVAGTGLSVNQNTGDVTITGTGGSGGTNLGLVYAVSLGYLMP